MACRYYDDLIVEKIKRWVPENSNLRVLKPNESKRLFELQANDNNDKPFTMPCIAVSRNNDIELLVNVKNPRSFDGLTLNKEHISANLSGLKGKEYEDALKKIPQVMAKLNVIPIKLEYQLDIYTKKYEEGDEYVRNFLFKLINNPLLVAEFTYNGITFRHTANIRVLTTVSDTSDIGERVFSGQFTRWTIQMELQDAFLFSIPYRQNWRLVEADLDVSSTLNEEGELEELDVGNLKSSEN